MPTTALPQKWACFPLGIGMVWVCSTNFDLRISDHREREDRAIVNGQIGHREREDRAIVNG